MVKPSNSASGHQKHHGGATKDVVGKTLKSKIKQLMDQIHAERRKSIKEKVERHWNNLEPLFSMLTLVISEREFLQTEKNINMLSSRINNPFCKFNSFFDEMVRRDQSNNVDQSSIASIKIPHREKLPLYTSWVYVARNMRMTKDQSVIGKYQIYYDKNGDETVFCSDNEEEIVNFKDVKHEFTEAEDLILRMALKEYGSTKEVLSIIKEFIRTNDSQILERYEKLIEKDIGILHQHSKDCDCRGCKSNQGICLEKNLKATLESFDNLFCRQCLIFDCPMHGTSQPLINLSEKQPVSLQHKTGRKLCSDKCYLLDKLMEDDSTLPLNESLYSYNESNKISGNRVTEIEELNFDASGEKNRTTYSASLKSLVENTSKKLTISESWGHDQHKKRVAEGHKDLINELEFNEFSNSTRVQAYEIASNSIWKNLERDLYFKGVEIFGENSCLISCNLFLGLKTCLEVAKYMSNGGKSMPYGSVPSSMMDVNEKNNAKCTDKATSSKSRLFRKKGKPKKFTHSRKFAGLPARWRKICDKDNLHYNQYTPCGCHGTCGKDCPCLLRGTCCEKYCGCLKVCNNRFKGCCCAKSQCQSRHCPCFAAMRECDPDVCRNCWVSCGDGSLGEPHRRGDGHCENMKLLLGKKERIILAKSKVAGWGAFAKNAVEKNTCLGEYTGELITHEEADMRGKVYLRINHSFVFNLNNKWVIDARRLGDKLKFANHSVKPNCHAKVMLAGGDHRVGIFAKENIEAGDELFYDYFYDKDCAPLWALPPKAEASKKNECVVSQGRVKNN